MTLQELLEMAVQIATCVNLSVNAYVAAARLRRDSKS